MIAVPKSIDNDILMLDKTFGGEGCAEHVGVGQGSAGQGSGQEHVRPWLGLGLGKGWHQSMSRTPTLPPPTQASTLLWRRLRRRSWQVGSSLSPGLSVCHPAGMRQQVGCNTATPARTFWDCSSGTIL